ncbi:hypothetical protein V1J52_02575 [Streptomyces sp. TRM 70351]|uniref:hypothetical protein n=1 Tax=Streptomyces sp. TRM 70351 TaxID=3116552 RepID=UPI002E7B07D8|nr:hypothetical protein [Streptomyces sp. TRM 70351]MEE1927076.1 hypothetical protein [Streptomyces sp. TRM 70351]
MRIGVRLGTREVHAALLHGARLAGAASAPHAAPSGPRAAGLEAATLEAAGRVLRGTAATAPSTITSVTWDISAPLEAALTAPAAGAPSGTVPRARPVAALRLVPRPPAVPAAGAHPAGLIRSLVAWRGTAPGGHDLFGTELAPPGVDAALRCAEAVIAAGLTTVAVTATGATARADHEVAVAAALLERFPELRLCLSHETGGLGLLEREATTVINAALLDPADTLISGCEQLTAALPGRPACWFATGDGGRVSGRRLCWLPVLGLAATPATALAAAARLAGTADALVVLVEGERVAAGQVREGLPHVESDLPGVAGVRTAAPQPVLTTAPARTAGTTLLAARTRHTADVIAALDAPGLRVAEEIVRLSRSATVLLRPEADLAATGAAGTEPSAWLDLLVPVGAAESLEEVQAQAEQRALGLVAAHGAEPGSARIVRSSATPVGYLRIYRLQVRAGSGRCVESAA